MLLGIDIGTSSIKGMLMEEDGKIVSVKSSGYPVEIPRAGWAQQDPALWWEGLCDVLAQMRQERPDILDGVRGIGFSGQMHGLTAVDREGNPVCPAIIWMDQRATGELGEIREKISAGEQGRILHNRVFNGFALASLLWMKNQDRGTYDRIYRVFQPKDYIRYRLTGQMGTDYSDASASLMLDVGKREWAWELLEKLGIDGSLLTPIGGSWEIAGAVTRKAAGQTGLPEGIPVVYGAGDQQAQSIGNGAVREGRMISNIGTGAQVSAFSASDFYDPELRTHTFCHAVPDAYTIYGAMLTGGMSLNWMKNQILREDSFEKLGQMAETVEPGSGGLVFLPYLSGERTPLMNPDAKGVFFGLTLKHEAAHMVRAVMEGVTFALRDSMEILEGLGVRAERLTASGGASGSPVWLQIQADILGKEIQVCRSQEQACLGACILAGVGIGVYPDISAACGRLVSFEEKVYRPRSQYAAMYEELYRKYHGIYQGTKNWM